MGDVKGYSVTAFWPKQEFDFSTGGMSKIGFTRRWRTFMSFESYAW